VDRLSEVEGGVGRAAEPWKSPPPFLSLASDYSSYLTGE